MAQGFILVTHDSRDRDDRASKWLEAKGYALERACPAEGSPIPAITEETAGVIIYGGAPCVDEQERYPFLADELRLIEQTLSRGIPFLGLCLGGQLLAHVLGRKVGPHPGGHAEYGYYDFHPTAAGRDILGAVPKVLQSHYHGWYETPDGAVALGGTEAFPEQAFRYGEAFGLQFHPEASRAVLERWIARRPPERYRLKGTFPPEQQLSDFSLYDQALGDWFYVFLARWAAPSRAFREAAE